MKYSKDMYRKWQTVAFFFLRIVEQIETHGTPQGSTVRRTFTWLLQHFLERKNGPKDFEEKAAEKAKVAAEGETSPKQPMRPEECFNRTMDIREAIAIIRDNLRNRALVSTDICYFMVKCAPCGFLPWLVYLAIGGFSSLLFGYEGLQLSGNIALTTLLISVTLSALCGGVLEWQRAKVREKQLLEIIMPGAYYELVRFGKIIRLLDNPREPTVDDLRKHIEQLILDRTVWVKRREKIEGYETDDAVPGVRREAMELAEIAFMVGLTDETKMKLWFDKADSHIETMNRNVANMQAGLPNFHLPLGDPPRLTTDKWPEVD